MSAKFPLQASTKKNTEVFNFRVFWGGRRGSNPQPPQPQCGALPLSYIRHSGLYFITQIFLYQGFCG